MRFDGAGRMAFAMIAMVLLLLSIFSGALIAMVSKETSTEAVAVQELRMLTDAIEEARIDVENHAYDVAVGVITEVVTGDVEEGNLSDAFMDSVNRSLTAKFPKTYGDVTISVDSHNITIQPLVMSTWDIVPSPPSDSPENRWGINTTGELNVTSRIPYYKVAGILNVTAVDENAPTWQVTKSITLDKEVANPYPMLAAGAKQVYYESSGGKGELGRVIRYILTTVAQYRVLAGFGTQGFAKDATRILEPSDVEMAVNLAILLQQARLFRTVDGASVSAFDTENNNDYDSDRQSAEGAGKLPAAERSLQRLLSRYVSSGTVDPADLIGLYIGLDGVPLDLERMVDLSAGDSLRDMFAVRHLRTYHASREFDLPILDLFSRLFRMMLRASDQPDLFENLVKKSDLFYLPWSAGAARWASGLVGDLVAQGGLDSRFSQSGHFRLLVTDNGQLYAVNATTTSRTAKVFSRETNCVDVDPSPLEDWWCDYYYTDQTYSILSPGASWTLRFDDQVVTDLIDAAVWESFYDVPIGGVVWKTMGQEMVTALYQLIFDVGREIARQAGARFGQGITINPKDFESIPESVYGAVYAALQGAADWFLQPAGQQWLQPRITNVVLKTAQFVLHLNTFLNGPIDLTPCKTPTKVVDYTRGYDCLSDLETRVQEAVNDRASQVFYLSGQAPLSSENWVQGPEMYGGNCTMGSLCGFDFWDQSTARDALRLQGMYSEIQGQVDWSVREASEALRADELQSVAAALTAFVGSPPDFSATAARLTNLIVGPGESFVSATVSYLLRSVNLVPLHDFLSLKILETAEFDQPFEFWLGNESLARDRGRVYRESLVVRQYPPYLRIGTNDLVRSAAQARTRFNGQVAQNFSGRLAVYLDLLPEGRYNTEVEHADRMPYQNRWNVSILGAYELNVSSVYNFLPGFGGPRRTYYNITIPLDMCLTIDPVTTWRLHNVSYRDLFEYVKNLNQQEQKEWWESLFGFLDIFNLFSTNNLFNVKEPVQSIAKHQIAISRLMISQLASGYVDAAVSSTMESMSNRLTTSEILWAAQILAASSDLINWTQQSREPLNLSYPGFEVLARPSGWGVNTPLARGSVEWLDDVNDGLAADGYNGPTQDAILRLDIVQGERNFCGDIENSHGFVTTWLVKKPLGLEWITDNATRNRFSGDIVAPLSYYAFNVRSAQVRFTSDPLRVQQYYQVGGQAQWTDTGGQRWGATVYLPRVEFFFTAGDKIKFDLPLIPGILTLSVAFGYTLHMYPEILAIPGQAFVNEMGGDPDGKNQWVEIWHPWTFSSSFLSSPGSWKLVAARSGSVQSLSPSVCSQEQPLSPYFTVCRWPGGFFSPGKAGRPINPLDSLMLLGSGERIVDYTPFGNPCKAGESFQRILDGAYRWVCESNSRGQTNWGTPLTQALDDILALLPGPLGGGLLGIIQFLGKIARAYRSIGETAAAIIGLSIWFSLEFTILFVISIKVTFAFTIDGGVIAALALWLMSSLDSLFHAIVSSSSGAVKAFPLDALLSGLWLSIRATVGIKTPDFLSPIGQARFDCGATWGWNIPRIMGWTTDPATAKEYWGTFCELTVTGPFADFLVKSFTVPSLRSAPNKGLGLRVWFFRLDKFALPQG